MIMGRIIGKRLEEAMKVPISRLGILKGDSQANARELTIDLTGI